MNLKFDFDQRHLDFGHLRVPPTQLDNADELWPGVSERHPERLGIVFPQAIERFVAFGPMLLEKRHPLFHSLGRDHSGSRAELGGAQPWTTRIDGMGARAKRSWIVRSVRGKGMSTAFVGTGGDQAIGRNRIAGHRARGLPMGIVGKEFAGHDAHACGQQSRQNLPAREEHVTLLEQGMKVRSATPTPSDIVGLPSSGLPTGSKHAYAVSKKDRLLGAPSHRSSISEGSLGFKRRRLLNKEVVDLVTDVPQLDIRRVVGLDRV